MSSATEPEPSVLRTSHHAVLPRERGHDAVLRTFDRLENKHTLDAELDESLRGGSTYRMITVIFRTERERMATDKSESGLAEAREFGLKEGSFVLGFAIPQACRYSIEATGGPQIALGASIAFYVACIAVTWFFYARREAEIVC